MRPLLTQKEAAAACGVSRTTIRRRREAGELPNAQLTEDRGWVIPVDDLIAAGFRLHAPAPPDAPPENDDQEQERGAEAETVAQLRAELERERHAHELEVLRERHGRELAEAQNAALQVRLEAQNAHLADLQTTLRALMPGATSEALEGPSVPSQQAPTEEPTGAKDAGEARRRWWGGRR